MLNVIILNAIMARVIMLSVVAPTHGILGLVIKIRLGLSSVWVQMALPISQNISEEENKM
jgi:hypothetical protein